MATFQSVADSLFDSEGCCSFDPFEAIRLLEMIANEENERDGPTDWLEVEEVVRFRGNITLAFPPSLIAQIIPPQSAPPDDGDKLSHNAAVIRRRYARRDVPVVVESFFSLFGPNGALPVIYTRYLSELDSESAYRGHKTRTALRDWLDIYNNRMMMLLFRAWQKYRMPVNYLRTVWRRPMMAPSPPPDPVTQVLFSMIGLGTPAHRSRLQISAFSVDDEPFPPLDRIDDRSLLHYAGAFARRRAGAHELRAILADYFDLKVQVETLTGQWLALPEATRTHLHKDSDAALGRNAITGEKVWDAGSKFRLRLGPLRYRQFVAFLPDPTPVPERKGVYLLSQLTRLYVGAELDFEIQLVLMKHEVPPCEMQDVSEDELGIRLGWNTWLTGDAMPDDVDDVRFEAPCETTLPKKG